MTEVGLSMSCFSLRFSMPILFRWSSRNGSGPSSDPDSCQLATLVHPPLSPSKQRVTVLPLSLWCSRSRLQCSINHAWFRAPSAAPWIHHLDPQRLLQCVCPLWRDAKTFVWLLSNKVVPLSAMTLETSWVPSVSAELSTTKDYKKYIFKAIFFF